MTLFFRRFIGALVLDAGAFEEIESDRHAAMQSVIVVTLVCLAGGFAAMGPGLVSVPAFITGVIVSLGAWLVWVAVIVTVGTVALRERQTHSDLPELLRVLGFAAAPGVFIALAAMRAVAPFVLVVVSIWMIAAAVVGVRQALDYRSTPRAIAVCAVSWLVTAGIVFAALMLSGTNVS
jgi:Na+-transporting NADH:ubiquinone oxidoreductase subunit NqrE